MSSKQLSIVLGVGVVILLTVVGYMVLRDNSQTDTLSQQNTAPNSNLLDNDATNAQPLNNTNTQMQQPTNTTPTSPKSYSYTNPDYGFKLVLNQNWQGYKVFKASNPREVYYKFCVRTNDKLWSESTEVTKGYACPFAISVISNENWDAMEADEQQRLQSAVVGIKSGTRYIFTPWQDPPSDLRNTDFAWEAIKKSFSI